MDSNEDILGPATREGVCWAGKTQRFQSDVVPRDTNASKDNILVNYKIYDSNNAQIASLNAYTNSNGISTIDYMFPAKGQYKILAYVGDEYSEFTLTIESLVDTVTLTCDINNILKGENVQLTAHLKDSLDVEHIVDAEGIPVTFNITHELDSFTEEKVIYDFYELEYDIQGYVDFECKAKSNGQCYLSIIPKNSNNETILLQFDYSSYKTVKVVDDGTSLKYYVDDVLQGTRDTGIKKLYVYGEGYVKELSMTTHDTVTATTDIDGDATVDYTYPGGTCTVKATANVGPDSNESNIITLYEKSSLFDGITLTSDKDILSYNGGNNPDSATLTAQLTKNGTNANVSGETVTFEVRKQVDDSLVETLTGTTDSSGKATVYFSAKHANSLYIQANHISILSDKIYVEDYWHYYDWNSISNWTRTQFQGYVGLVSNEVIQKGQEVIFTFESDIPIDSQFGISGTAAYTSVLRLHTNGSSVIHSNSDRNIMINPQKGDVFSVKIINNTAYWYKNGTQIHSNYINVNGEYNIRVLQWSDYPFTMSIKVKS